MLPTIHTQSSRQITDLAADLTDIALEALAGPGASGDSVALELGLWHALADILERESRPGARHGGPLRPVLEAVIARAVGEVSGAEARRRPAVTPLQRSLLAGLFARRAAAALRPKAGQAPRPVALTD